MRNQHSCYEHEVTFGDGNSHRFEILDLSDCRRIDEKAEKQFEEHIKWGDVFFLMFSITGIQFSLFFMVPRLDVGEKTLVTKISATKISMTKILST